MQRQVIAQQLGGTDEDVELFDLATERQHLRHPRHRLQVEFDQPVLDLAHLLRAALAGGVFHNIEEDLAQPCGNGPHLWFPKPFGDLFARQLQPFVDQLAGEVNVGAVLKVDIDHRQAEVRYGTDLLEIGQAVHGHLDGVGDVLFDFFWCQALGFGEHLHQRRGDVGKRVHRELLIAVIAGGQDQRPQHHHQQATAQGKLDELLHGCASSLMAVAIAKGAFGQLGFQGKGAAGHIALPWGEASGEFHDGIVAAAEGHGLWLNPSAVSTNTVGRSSSVCKAVLGITTGT